MANATSTGGSLNTLTLTTIQNYLPKMADNLTSGSGIFSYMKRKGLVAGSDPLIGREEVLTLDREAGDDGEWWDGADSFSLKPTSGLVDSYVGHHNYRKGTYIADTELLENTGKAMIRSRLKTRLMALERSMKIDVAQALVGTRGTGSRAPEGLRDVMGGGTPTTPSTFQRLAYSTNTWWAPVVKVITSLGPNNSGIREGLIDVILDLRVNMASPKVGICDQKFLHEFLLQVGGGRELAGYPTPNVRQFAGDRPTGRFDPSGSFDAYFHGIEIIFDPYVSVPSAYTAGTDAHINLVDTDFYEIATDPRMWMKMFKPRERAGDDKQWVDRYSLALRLTTRCYKRNAQALMVIDL